jgi:N-acetylmuramoyl-L-alanine amidase
VFIAKKGKIVAALLAVLIVIQLTLTTVMCVKLYVGDDLDTDVYAATVVIDAGHGGIDGGVVGVSGTKESDLNLIYAKALGDAFKARGFRVVYTRTDKGGLYGAPTKGFKRRDMIARRDIIKNANPDLMLSVHMNRFSDAKRRGPQVFFQNKSDNGRLLAQSLQTSLNNFTGNHHTALSGDFYVCRCVPAVPSVIVECGFLSNFEEEQQLLTLEYCQQLVEVIFSGAMLYLYGL